MTSQKQLEKNMKKLDSFLGVGFAMMYIATGLLLGILIMYLTHRDMYLHYNSCQEQQLLDSIAEMKTEKNWYIKEDSKGKLKIVELSRQELDSLTKSEQ